MGLARETLVSLTANAFKMSWISHDEYGRASRRFLG
eukprot:SAG11_NODE_33677_length_276_cov_0.570621_1_plen_35_part_10